MVQAPELRGEPFPTKHTQLCSMRCREDRLARGCAWRPTALRRHRRMGPAPGCSEETPQDGPGARLLRGDTAGPPHLRVCPAPRRPEEPPPHLVVRVL